MNSSNIISVSARHNDKQHVCSQCSLIDLCLPMGLNSEELVQLEALIQQSQSYQESEFLFRQHDPFQAIYAVRSGMFKSYTLDAEGNERILGFHLPGELVGLDAIYSQQYPSNVEALDTSSVCTVPYQGLMALAEQIPSLQQQLLRLLSKEINSVNALTYDNTADQRLLAFLWGLSTRYEQRGYSGSHVNLSMSRRDIANHLNMAPETISRLFKRMQDRAVIQLNKRELIITNADALKALAGCKPHQQ